MSSEPILISSSLTSIHSGVFPKICLGAAAFLGGLRFILEPSTVHWTTLLIAPAIWFAAFFNYKFRLASVQQVWMDDTSFYVGELSRRRIPFAAVAEVNESSLACPKTITIVMKNAETIPFILGDLLFPIGQRPTCRRIREKMEASLQNEPNSIQSSHEP